MQEIHVFERIESSPNFPNIPARLTKIISMLQDPRSVDIDDLVDQVRMVDDIESTILAYINSEYFNVRRKVSDLREAIIYLGMHTMQIIIIAIITNYLFPSNKDYTSRDKKFRYLKHSIGTAVASCAIADLVGPYDKYELFTYGLLHDIGVVVLDICCPDLMEEIITIMKRGSHQIIAEKVALKGITHQETGAWLCEKLNFPPNIADVIKNHHRPLMVENPSQVINYIHLGDIISTKYYEALFGIDIQIIPNQLYKTKFDISEKDVQKISRELPDEIEKVLTLFKRVL